MKIYFNPKAEAHGYVDFERSDAVINEIYVDENGLLEQLELRAGLSYTAFSDMEREAFYLKSLDKHSKDSFYEKSFQADGWGTARQLLQWRDKLIMAGWTKEMRGISDRLDCMAGLEDEVLPFGISDRWRQLFEELKKDGVTNPLKKDDVIEVHCAVELISPIVLQVLDLIKDNDNNNVKYCHYKDNDRTLEALPVSLSECKCNIKAFEFPDRNSAYLWLACQKDISEKTVVVNQNNKMLDNILYSMNQPEIQSSIQDGNPGIIQLFKLGFSLFERPINANNLLSYLQLTTHPLPGKIRNDLAGHLQSEGGRGEKWDEIIRNYDFTVKEEKKGKLVTKDKREEKMEFLKPLVGEYERGVPKEDLVVFSDALSNWAKNRQFAGQCSETEITQLTTIRNYCAALNRVLNDAKEVIEQKQLMKWVKSIYRPIRIRQSSAQSDSVNIICDILGLISSPEKLIWLDCNYAGKVKYLYNFLSFKEIEGLRKNRADIPSESAMLKAIHDDRIRAIAKIKQELLVVTAIQDGNEVLHEHPFVAELKKLGDRVEWLETPPVVEDKEERDCVSYPLEYYYNIGKGRDFKREKEESYSSIEKLVQCPFDYVLDYFAKLPDYESGVLPDINTTQGKVAHLMIQMLTEDADYDIDRMQELFNKSFDQYLKKALDATGIILLLPENKLELVDFTQKIKKSIPILIEIIRQNKLKPIACEKDVKVKLDKIEKFKAVIDMLLEDENKKKVVFDFKWSKTGNYRKKLEQGAALQLELYKQALLASEGEDSFGGSAYYILPDAKLLSYDVWLGPAGSVEQIAEPDGLDEFFTRAKNSFTYRKNELKKGKVEEGETLPMKVKDVGDPSGEKIEFDYLKQPDLIPLESAYGEENENLKGSPYVAKLKKKTKSYKKPKLAETPNEQPTTHIILKGHVK